jgi:hypothetical protein
VVATNSHQRDSPDIAEVTTSQLPNKTGIGQEWMIRDVPRLIRQYSVSWTLVRWIGIGQNLGVACTVLALKSVYYLGGK